MNFDIVCPSYNYGRFIGDAAQSILCQEVDVRFIVADGASTDDTVERLGRLQDSRVDCVSEPDSGQSDALNKALARTEASVIGWLNADEYYLPGALSAVAAAFAEDPRVDLVYGDVWFVDEDGDFERALCQPDWSPFTLRNRGCYISTCSAFVRRNLIAGFAFDDNLRTVMDWDFFLHASSRARRVVHLRRPLGAFRAHDARVTAQPTPRTSVEHLRVRARHDLPSGKAIGVSTLVGDWVHRSRKLLNGGVLRERRLGSWRGTPTRWMADQQQLANVQEMLVSSHQVRRRPFA